MSDYRTTRDKIAACREKFNLGIDAAKRIVERDKLRADIADADTLEDIRRVLLQAFPAHEHGDDY